ncbi:MAG TPA: hypothetical protein VLA54_10065 [Acidimicrobiia bacterium]|jgi:hypothetical protein|nr:hypothetical protein [Acidimicrobiia bacterium]
MKRFLRVVAVIGALVGVAWAMRERLISIPAPREKAPPVFRVAEEDGVDRSPAEPA